LESVPLISSNKTRLDYDATLVGSGATGRQAAYTLAMEDNKALVLGAGRNYEPARDLVGNWIGGVQVEVENIQ
jgi:choline dehydrogenase-like flavoprotein